MPQYVIEREIPGAGAMSAEQLRDASRHSNAVLAGMDPAIEWVQSYVAGDRIYCVYNAPSEDLIREHADRSGFPANRITPVSAVISPLQKLQRRAVVAVMPGAFPRSEAAGTATPRPR